MKAAGEPQSDWSIGSNGVREPGQSIGVKAVRVPQLDWSIGAKSWDSLVRVLSDGCESSSSRLEQRLMRWDSLVRVLERRLWEFLSQIGVSERRLYGDQSDWSVGAKAVKGPSRGVLERMAMREPGQSVGANAVKRAWSECWSEGCKGTQPEKSAQRRRLRASCTAVIWRNFF